MRSLNLFLDWDSPTSYAVDIEQSDGLNTDINAQSLSSKDYHKYEPRRAKASFFRDQFSGNNLLKFDYLIDGENIPTKWNKYKACIKDGDDILFRGIIDNTSIKYKESRLETSVTIHDIITLLNFGLDNLEKTYTWRELSTPQNLSDLLSEMVEDSLQHGDRDMATPSNWYAFDFTIPTVTLNNDLVYRLDKTAFEDLSNSVNFPNQYEWRKSEYTLRDDGDYVRLYCITEWATEDPTEPEGAQTISVQRRIHVYLMDNSQAVQDFAITHFDQESIYVENNNEYTTNSGFEFFFPIGINNYSVEREGVTYNFDVNTGRLTATGETQITKVFLNKDGATEEGVSGNSDDGIYLGYNLGGKQFSYRDLFKMITYLWNLSIHTTATGVIEFTNKQRSGLSPSAVEISDSDLSGTEYKSLLYTQPDIESIFKPLAQSWVKPIIKRIADESYSGVYGTKIITTTVPTSYGLSLESTFLAYDKQYKVAKIKNNKRGTFAEIEGWSE